MLARGSTIKPIFEKIEFQNEDGSLKEKDLVLTRAPVTGFLMDESAQVAENVKATKKAYDESAVTVVGSADFALAAPGLGDKEGDESEGEDADELEGRTMEEKLQDLAVEESSHPTGKKSKPSASKNKYSTPKANSLQQMLIQALHSNDLQLLEACLTFNNVEVIRNTVRRLPTTYVVPFLTQVIHKFQQKPNRGEALLEWIKAVLLIHTAYLMTVPDLVKKLSNFYQTLDARVSVFQKLLNLHGRLDLVMSQIEMRQQYEAEDTTNVAATIYVEDDDEDDVEEEDLDLDMEDDDEDDDLVGEADAFEEEEVMCTVDLNRAPDFIRECAFTNDRIDHLFQLLNRAEIPTKRSLNRKCQTTKTKTKMKTMNSHVRISTHSTSLDRRDANTHTHSCIQHFFSLGGGEIT